MIIVQLSANIHSFVIMYSSGYNSIWEFKVTGILVNFLHVSNESSVSGDIIIPHCRR